jgi:hypothetical protein
LLVALGAQVVAVRDVPDNRSLAAFGAGALAHRRPVPDALAWFARLPSTLGCTRLRDLSGTNAVALDAAAVRTDAITAWLREIGV